jgi:hypothetical protein
MMAGSEEALLRRFADAYLAARAGCARGVGPAAFELDFEAHMALFFASHIASAAGASGPGARRGGGHRLAERVRERLGWSRVYRDLLHDRLARQPSFDVEDFRASRGERELALAVYGLAAAVVCAEGAFGADERALLAALRARLFGGSHEPEVRALESALGELAGADGARALAELRRADTVAEQHVVRSLEEVMTELDALVGLDAVKREVRTLASFLAVQRQRQAAGLPSTGLSHHMVFTGSPGTGKTTVGRLIAQVFCALGCLRRGHLVETDRSGLVGQYVGHTEGKTSEIVERALDGILFIDEAYSLAQGGASDFGRRAIDTLVKRMEDHRDRLIVIVAGYSDEMKALVEANPGLRSRFNTWIHFPNYSAEELESIFEKLAEKSGYRVLPAMREKLRRAFDVALRSEGRSFGNGRYVRNAFERIVRNQALRLSTLGPAPTREQLMELLPADVVQDGTT